MYSRLEFKKIKKVNIQSCAEQSAHENPLKPVDYANPGSVLDDYANLDQVLKTEVFYAFFLGCSIDIFEFSWRQMQQLI